MIRMQRPCCGMPRAVRASSREGRLRNRSDTGIPVVRSAVYQAWGTYLHGGGCGGYPAGTHQAYTGLRGLQSGFLQLPWTLSQRGFGKGAGGGGDGTAGQPGGMQADDGETASGDQRESCGRHLRVYPSKKYRPGAASASVEKGIGMPKHWGRNDQRKEAAALQSCWRQALYTCFTPIGFPGRYAEAC